MLDKARQIISMDPRSPYIRYAGGLIGLPLERIKDPVTGRAAIYDGQFKYLLTLKRGDLDKLNTWATSNKLGVFLGRSFYLGCTIGYPDTPEQVAYDAIDQADDTAPKNRKCRPANPRQPKTRKSRLRPQ